MTLRRLASLAARARVSSVSSGLELNSTSPITSLTNWSPCAVSSQSRASSAISSIYKHIHGSGCRCGGCCRSTTYNMVPGPRFVSGSSSAGLAQAEEAQAVEDTVDSEFGGRGGVDGVDRVDTSFIHPTEAAQHHSHSQNNSEDGNYWLMQPVYDSEYLEVVKPRYVSVDRFVDPLEGWFVGWSGWVPRLGPCKT